MRTGRGKVPAWTIRHSVVRDTPINSRTRRGLMNCTCHLTIAPYAGERQQFLANCREQGFAKTCLKQVAGILLTAATDLQAHGGLDVDQAGLEAAATRIERVRSEAGFTRGARGYRRAFLRLTTRWLLFTGHLQDPAPRPRPYTALLDDFARWMSEERGLSPGTLNNRRWHVGKFLDWLHDRGRRVTDLDLRDLDAYLQHLHANGLSRVTIRIQPTPSGPSSATPSGEAGAPPASLMLCTARASIVRTGCRSAPRGMTSAG